MNMIFINKIKNALNTSHPIDAVKEIVTEYEEVHRLVQWKKSIILSGEKIDNHRIELDRVDDILEDYGIYSNIYDCDLDKKVREYFQSLN